MKKLLCTTLAVSALTIGLASCGTFNGMGMGVADPVVDTRVDTLSGHRATKQDIAVYRKKGVVYRNGHTYHIRNGKYILVR
ncbi:MULTISPECIES: hypothetical protein [unclassified Legionella]|uniref:hypothetical protein n=1 Tax=unclassified Legionella TaxID=2622702 RepID=UPI001054F6B9|nr:MULTISPECIES: hypothetical protein [unclassified Legionella]MDI9819159.1 hypothetical protein [Legionella sp. PL877]